VEKGVRQALEAGPVSGHPVQDVRVIVYDGKYHAVDSKEVAFVAAGKKAFLDAMSKARPVVLEPIVNIDVYAPPNTMGDIAGELSGKRGQVSGNDAGSNGLMKVTARAPLAELDNFQSRLKSLTGGQGSYTLEFSHYDAAPPNIQAQLAAQYKPAGHDD
jgi:elongation factor G